jgi:hypothetical protein
MAYAERKLATLDAATRALWRVAENGDVAELNELLPRVTDINARNEHGVTALMRAAQSGHLKMVRVLLENGADANIKRNDKFTALALAAFFGYTEVVRALMEHGADSQAATRGGTSPQMWATARTFSEVADQLERPAAPKPAPVIQPVSVVKAVSIAKEAAAAPVVRQVPLVVRTLKEPPEIWDLVHEAPRGFNPRSAFLTRLKSSKSGFAFRAAAAVVLISMCVVGVLVLRGVQARSERNIEPQPDATIEVTSESATSQAVSLPPAENPQPENSSQPAASAPVAANEPVAAPQAAANSDSDKLVAVRKFNSSSRVVSSHRVERGVARVSVSEAVHPTATPEKSEPPVRVEATAKPKTTVPLSPQLITPAKSSTPKAKVIQWP